MLAHLKSAPCSIGIRCSWFRSVGPRAVSLLRLILLSPLATTSIYSAGRGAGSPALELCCFLFPALCNMLCKLCSTVPCTVRLSIGGSGEAKRENHRLSNTVSEKPSEEHGVSHFWLQSSKQLRPGFNFRASHWHWVEYVWSTQTMSLCISTLHSMYSTLYFVRLVEQNKQHFSACCTVLLYSTAWGKVKSVDTNQLSDRQTCWSN